MIEIWDGKTFSRTISRPTYEAAMKAVGEAQGYPTHAHKDFDELKWHRYNSEISKRLA